MALWAAPEKNQESRSLATCARSVGAVCVFVGQSAVLNAPACDSFENHVTLQGLNMSQVNW